MKKLSLILFAVALVTVIAIGCGKVADTTATGTVSGTIYAADGTSPIGGATVSTDPISSSSVSSQTISAKATTTTASDGSFSLTAPVGTTTLYAAKGSFGITISVSSVTQGQTTNIGNQYISPEASGATVPDIAVIQGSYDTIETIIAALGYSYNIITPADLLNSTLINTYEAIFINCGAAITYWNNSTVQSNLQNFVSNGGSLYASDWAHSYVEGAWPSAIDFFGSDTSPGAAKVGNASTITGEVLDNNLKTYVLGKSSVSIVYNLSSWVVVNAAGSGTSVLIQGDVQSSSPATTSLAINRSIVRTQAPSIKYILSDKPLALSFTSGTGKVIYTTFHNEAQITTDMDKILKDFILSL